MSAIIRMNSHKTAIKRTKPSAPVQWLIKNEFLLPDVPTLDYGCGKGDIRYSHLPVVEYDPHFQPAEPAGLYLQIYCGYVLNTLGYFERLKVLRKIRAHLARCGTAYIAVRRDILKDGHTSNGTFQCNIDTVAGAVLLHHVPNRYSIFTIKNEDYLSEHFMG